ncbi:S8 family serine peptidase [Flavobacterium sp. SM2513]|uniref:S8 family serine peptidase n=1 Tax=Flavobacterium sp. SM2513 TaxID=3424766 RepID=UPI003D7F8013
MNFKLSFVVVLICGVATAQNKLEERKIIATYDGVQSEKLIKNLIEDELSCQARVEEYLNRVPNSVQQFKKEGVVYRMTDVLNGKPFYIATDNSAAARSIRVNNLYPGGALGLSLEGEGLFVGVWDGGSVLKTHNEFMSNGVSKVTTPDAGANPETELHATHVAGTVGAKGFVNSAKGMAPKVDIKSYTWTSDAVEVVNEVTNNAMLISNHSYGVPIYNSEGSLNVPGTWFMGCYSDSSRNWDVIAYNYPYYLPVMSAGNEGTTSYADALLAGYDKLTGNKTSKNLLIIANANPNVHPITGVMTSLAINFSSSQGPTDDGRIKPDIAADGTQLYSSSNASISSYDTLSGTSMASPSVSGALTLLQEHYNNLYPDEFMKAATAKGLVCHTAFDDSESVGPDPKFGWGLLDAREAATVLTNSVASTPTAVVSELNLSNGGTYTVQVTINAIKKLKATLCWTDPAGTVKNNQLNSPDPVLVNDLDIRIIKGEEINFPWKLDLSNISGPAIKGDNLVDNVEKVEVDNAIGTYTIQVSHKGTLVGGAQNYSLVISGFDQANLSSDTFNKEKISVYPNPLSDVLNVASSSDFFTGYQLYDIQGRLIKKELLSDLSSFQINTSSLSKGLYILNLVSPNGNFARKIIKE